MNLARIVRICTIFFTQDLFVMESDSQQELQSQQSNVSQEDCDQISLSSLSRDSLFESFCEPFAHFTPSSPSPIQNSSRASDASNNPTIFNEDLSTIHEYEQLDIALFQKKKYMSIWKTRFRKKKRFLEEWDFAQDAQELTEGSHASETMSSSKNMLSNTVARSLSWINEHIKYLGSK